jgi:acetoin utilization protein AcuB
MLNAPIHTIMSQDLITMAPNETLGRARDIFLENRIHHLPIVEGKKLVGIVTSWDLFKTGKSAEEYSAMKASDIMTRKIATLEPDDHIGAAAEVLREHLFHAVPIVNDDHELVGMVTSFDIIKIEYDKEYPEDLSRFVEENMR